MQNNLLVFGEKPTGGINDVVDKPEKKININPKNSKIKLFTLQR